MKPVPFVKMHGAGNDFIMVDDREGIFPTDDYRRIAGMASRRLGIGCEGVILVERSERLDFRMRFFNPDGSEAELCGNGARCVAAFAHAIGAAPARTMTFETAAGDLTAELVEDSLVRIAMPSPAEIRDDFAVIGVPHRIVVVENLAKVDVEREGRRIRRSAEFAPGGTNVDFVVYRAPYSVAMRTYERGVEAESGACGTGAVAAAVVGVRDYALEFPVRVKTSQGYELVVNGRQEGDEFVGLSLTGPVKRVFEGVIDFDSIDEFAE